MHALNRCSIVLLTDFVAQPSRPHAQRLIVIPGIYHVLEHEHWTQGRYADNVVGLCKWMLQRGEDTLQRILKGNPEPFPITAFEKKDWQKVSSCKFLEIVRLRLKGIDWMLLCNASDMSTASISSSEV